MFLVHGGSSIPTQATTGVVDVSPVRATCIIFSHEQNRPLGQEDTSCEGAAIQVVVNPPRLSCNIFF
jgi:hypothetical protein